MANVRIQERFMLAAAPDLVWSYLVDPARIVVCIPGAELLGQDDEKTYSGAVKVKVGAVTMAYRGKMVFEEIDDAQRYVRMVGRGREKSGSGTASMTMESRVLAREDGSSEVTVDAEIKIAGKIVRFGRGMIETVSGELFKEFTARLAGILEEEIALRAGGSDLPPHTADAAAGDTTREDNAVSLIPLLFRAFRSWLRRILGRG
jgi:hypothetical protein